MIFYCAQMQYHIEGTHIYLYSETKTNEKLKRTKSKMSFNGREWVNEQFVLFVRIIFFIKLASTQAIDNFVW